MFRQQTRTLAVRTSDIVRQVAVQPGLRGKYKFSHRLYSVPSVKKHEHSTNLAKQLVLALPPRVKGWPTPWLNESEATQYLYPLYSRGWEYNVVSKKVGGNWAAVGHLTTTYSFSNFRSAIDFTKDLADISDKENHHPTSIHIINGSTVKVSVSINTHSALRPELNNSSPLKLPGVTLRDIRFAVLSDTHFSTVYVADGRGGDSKHIQEDSLFSASRPEWKTILQQLGT